jgi:hypothetical protein
VRASKILILILSLLLSAPAYAKLSKQKKQVLKRQALAKKPKPMFLMKKATEDLDVEEPKQDILQRHFSTVVSDERFYRMD